MPSVEATLYGTSPICGGRGRLHGRFSTRFAAARSVAASPPQYNNASCPSVTNSSRRQWPMLQGNKLKPFPSDQALSNGKGRQYSAVPTHHPLDTPIPHKLKHTLLEHKTTVQGGYSSEKFMAGRVAPSRDVTSGVRDLNEDFHLRNIERLQEVGKNAVRGTASTKNNNWWRKKPDLNVGLLSIF